MKPLKNRFSITLDEDIASKIKEMAEEDDRSFSQYINMVLREWPGRERPEGRTGVCGCWS